MHAIATTIVLWIWQPGPRIGSGVGYKLCPSPLLGPRKESAAFTVPIALFYSGKVSMNMLYTATWPNQVFFYANNQLNRPSYRGFCSNFTTRSHQNVFRSLATIHDFALISIPPPPTFLSALQNFVLLYPRGCTSSSWLERKSHPQETIFQNPSSTQPKDTRCIRETFAAQPNFLSQMVSLLESSAQLRYIYWYISKTWMFERKKI